MLKKKHKKTKNFLIPILSLVVLSIVAAVWITTFIHIGALKEYINKDIQKRTQSYINKNKKEIYNKVHLVDDSIKFQKSLIEKELKKSIKMRIETSLHIAQYIYDTQKNKLSKKQIIKIIAGHLGSIEFNDGRGYYYVSNYKTNILYTHKIKKFIGRNMTNAKDKKGNNLVKLRNDALKNGGIGFYKVYFNKPNDLKHQFPKLNAVVLFKPLNIVIGTGEYLDAVKKQTKKRVLYQFNNLQKTKKNYLFILDYHKIDGKNDFAKMLLNVNKPTLIGKNLTAKYEDIKWNKFFKEVLDKIAQNGECYVRYWYKNPLTNKPALKISYFYLNKDWNWIIGSGFYLDKLNIQIGNMENKAIDNQNALIYNSIVLIIILLIILIAIATIISMRIDNTINQYTDTISKNKEIQIEQEKKLLQQSRLSQMGEMIGMIAHQWRQPLNSISLTASNLQFKCMIDDMNKDYFQKELELVDKYSQHLSSTIDDFRGFFKDHKIKELTTFKKLVDATLDIVQISVENKNIKLITNYQNEEEFETYSNEVKQVILNLIKNAEDILLEKKIENPTITIEVLPNKQLIVKDNAGGIPEDIIDKIFDPYFSTKLEKDGTGLGLYMSKVITEEHCGGKLEVSNDKDGAVFKINLTPPRRSA